MTQRDRLPVDLLAIKNILRDAVGADAWEVMPNKLRLVHRVVQMAREAHKLGYIGGVLDTTAAVSEIIDAPRQNKPAAPKSPRIITLDNPADLTGLLDHISQGKSPDTYKPKGNMHDNMSNAPYPFITCGNESFPASWAPVIYEPNTWRQIAKRANPGTSDQELDELDIKLSNLPPEQYRQEVGSLMLNRGMIAAAQEILPVLIEEMKRNPKTKH